MEVNMMTPTQEIASFALALIVLALGCADVVRAVRRELEAEWARNRD